MAKQKESLLEWFFKKVLGIVLTVIVGGIAIMLGDALKVEFSKLIYKWTGYKNDCYKKWEREQEKEREKEEKRKKLQAQLKEQEKNSTPQASAFTYEQAAEMSEREWLIDDWLYDNDLVVLFGPPKSGKSTLAMQMARDLAEGRLSEVFPMECPRQKQWVFYYHLEMTQEEVMTDYPDLLHNAHNIDYFIRPKGINDAKNLVDDIRAQIEKRRKSTVTVIVDNLSRLGGGTAVSDKKVLKYIGELKDEMAEKYKVKLTIILLNHTDRDKYKEYAKLEPNMMRGSENLYREVGLLFSINNTCEGEDIKMIKMNARRGAAKKTEVIVVQRCKTPGGRWCFNYLRDDDEVSLLLPKLSYKKTIVGKEQNDVTDTMPKRGKNLKLTLEQEARIVEIYHLLGDNLNAAAKAVRESEEELLREIEKFAPLQVDRIVKKYEKQSKPPIVELQKKMA